MYKNEGLLKGYWSREKEKKRSKNEQCIQAQRGSKELLDAWYPQTDLHTPLLLRGEWAALSMVTIL